MSLRLLGPYISFFFLFLFNSFSTKLDYNRDDDNDFENTRMATTK
jgi:hypothetical protein